MKHGSAHPTVLVPISAHGSHFMISHHSIFPASSLPLALNFVAAYMSVPAETTVGGRQRQPVLCWWLCRNAGQLCASPRMTPMSTMSDAYRSSCEACLGRIMTREWQEQWCPANRHTQNTWWSNCLQTGAQRQEQCCAANMPHRKDPWCKANMRF